MFTVEQRDLLRDWVLHLAADDVRVVAGAEVGSLAVGQGDHFSDLDLTFGVADYVPTTEVLADWSRTLSEELAAVQLADLEVGATIYRVFLLPDALPVRSVDGSGITVSSRWSPLPASLWENSHRRTRRPSAAEEPVHPDAA